MKKNKSIIIDAHHHLWDLNLKKNSWLLEEATEENHLGNIANLCHSYLIADFFKDSQDFMVEKSVHIQAGWDKSDPLGESLWLLKLNEQSNFPNAVVAYADLSNPFIESTLAQLAAIPNVRGIRQILSWHENSFYRGCDKNYIEIDQWEKNFNLLKKYNFSFDMQIYPEQVNSILPIIARADKTNIVIDHALMPVKRDKDYLRYWREQMKKLSRFQNVKIKISGLGMFDHAWTPQSLKEIIFPVVETFLPTRCMLGSNFPVDKLYGSYESLLSAYIKAISAYSENEQRDILYNTAENFYKI